MEWALDIRTKDLVSKLDSGIESNGRLTYEIKDLVSKFDSGIKLNSRLTCELEKSFKFSVDFQQIVPKFLSKINLCRYLKLWDQCDRIRVGHSS
ncbi:hypothetical protein CEXT_397181 [Caerostris extrusa]|uniref:Uncharacterized protein n=1 Tax=Caerostris extrusa TaxID=172846 RepID=A0AAV4Q0U4_CAEEX|nr:hypothetical protein CEXT_397181 [Caerostris extrusa]